MARESILVVEDSEITLKLVENVLRNKGYEVQTAASAEEAMAAIGRQKPALMLVDVVLPGMSGLEFTARIKRKPAFRDLPAIAFTACDGKQEEEDARKAGCDAYLAKPINGPALTAFLDRFLRDRAPAVGARVPAADDAGNQASSHGKTVSNAVAADLWGTSIALIGMADDEADRLCDALASVKAKPRLFSANDPPELKAIRGCSAVVLHVRAETAGSAWLAPGPLPQHPPLILLGARECLHALDFAVRKRAADLLIEGWEPGVALNLLRRILSNHATAASQR